MRKLSKYLNFIFLYSQKAIITLYIYKKKTRNPNNIE